jgi:phage-related baseplate assembly protein
MDSKTDPGSAFITLYHILSKDEKMKDWPASQPAAEEVISVLSEHGVRFVPEESAVPAVEKALAQASAPGMTASDLAKRILASLPAGAYVESFTSE